MFLRLPESPPMDRRSRRARIGVGFGLLAVSLLAAAIAALPGCRTDALRDPLRREPAVLIDGAALARLLTRVAGLAGTPAGAAAQQLVQRLRDCPEVAGHFALPAASIAAQLDRLVCRGDRPLDPALAALLETERGAHAGLLQWPIGEAGRLVVRIAVDDAGGLAVDGFLEEPDGDGPAALLVPAAEAPGPPAIGRAASLVHLRLRPANGLRLAELIPQGSQGDRLFALKGRLLEGALLEGTLELGFVPPAPGGAVPLAVLALHHRAAAPIESALGEALDQLERTWGLVRSPRSFALASGPRSGGCYADVPILPEFAPCWVVTDEALLLGYRAEAVEAALAAARSVAPDDAADPAVASGVVVDFDRVHALDAASAGPSGASLAALYSRLELRGRTGSDGRIALEGRLRARR